MEHDIIINWSCLTCVVFMYFNWSWTDVREEVQVSSVIAITEGGTQEGSLRQDTNSRGTVERSLAHTTGQ